MDYDIKPYMQGKGMSEDVESFAKEMFDARPVFWFGVLILLAILVVYYMYKMKMQGFQPTQTAYMQQNDTVAVSGSGGISAWASGYGTPNQAYQGPPEHLVTSQGVTPAGPQSASSGVPMPIQLGGDSSASGLILNGPIGPATQPGTMAYQILNSPDYNCANRVQSGNNAWGWMTNVAYSSPTTAAPSESYKEGMDNTLSQIMAGH